MSDFDDFINPEEEPEGEIPEEFEDFLGQMTEEGLAVNPNRVITIITTGGGHAAIPVEENETLSIGEVMDRANLSVGSAVEYYVGGEPRPADYQVAGGTQLSVVGVVKGG